MSERINSKAYSITAVTMGDPSGIGPEIILKSFEKPVVRKTAILAIGDLGVMERARKMLNIKSFSLKSVASVAECTFSPDILNIMHLDLIRDGQLQPGIVNAASGEAAFQCVRKAVELIRQNEIASIVTAPLNKEAIHMAGHYYPGHTEILASLSGTRNYAMLLYDRKLSVIHVSTHISLLEAITRLSQDRIERVIELADLSMRKLCGRAPRIAVAGINPHAGENGLFGNEEQKIIRPAVMQMKEKGIQAEGPLPPDTVFLQAIKGDYDVVVAMYHDQGHIPLKLLGFSRGVNITVGLPFVRTSVDHGTAFGIAWQGLANEESMTEAIKLARKLSK
jgi:4-phospho-D-threonate 3-dehydrogenase / 4-phospho-D-erythronate 3-dehydrogenase